MLNYKKIRRQSKAKDEIGHFIWFHTDPYKSWTGVELTINRYEDCIFVSTRSRISRSHWDLEHQCKTIKNIYDFFGGYFVTDIGKNKLWKPSAKAPSDLASACYLAHWNFRNNIKKAQWYMSNRNIKENSQSNKLLNFIYREFDPTLLSNNFIIPYLIAIWEDFCRSVFVAVLINSNKKEANIKKLNFNSTQLEKILIQNKSIETAIAENFTFQRPSKISEIFKIIEPKLDLSATLKKPIKRRRETLYETIEMLIELRNDFVHKGTINHDFKTNRVSQIITNLDKAAAHIYDDVAKHFEYEAIYRIENRY